MRVNDGRLQKEDRVTAHSRGAQKLSNRVDTAQLTDRLLDQDTSLTGAEKVEQDGASLTVLKRSRSPERLHAFATSSGYGRGLHATASHMTSVPPTPPIPLALPRSRRNPEINRRSVRNARYRAGFSFGGPRASFVPSQPLFENPLPVAHCQSMMGF